MNDGKLVERSEMTMGHEFSKAQHVMFSAEDLTKSSSALLWFNLAILLEDLSREAEAMVSYPEALAQDPLPHDSH